MPGPAYGTLTDLPELVAAITTQIATITGYAAKLVFLTLLDDEEIAKTPPGNDFITIRLGKFAAIKGVVAGGGGATFDGTLLVQLWHRQDNDQHARAADYLLSSGGVLSKWLPLLGGLQLFTPLRATDATKALVMEPMRTVDFDVPKRRPPGWGRLDSAWNVKLNHRLS